MKRNALGLAGLVLAYAGLHAAPAAAQVNVELAATNIHYTLVDLTPDDGEAPWIRFTTADWTPISWSASLTPQPGNEQSQGFNESRHVEFELSPNTQVVFRFDTHLALHAPTTDPRQYANAEIFSHMDISTGSGKGREEYTYNSMGDNAYVGQQDYSSGADFSRDSYGDISALTHGDPGVGIYDVHADAYLYSAAAPVPEAPAPVMFAAGLGVLGMLARRRSRGRG
jgi:hypothetical protein